MKHYQTGLYQRGITSGVLPDGALPDRALPDRALPGGALLTRHNQTYQTDSRTLSPSEQQRQWPAVITFLTLTSNQFKAYNRNAGSADATINFDDRERV